MVWLAPKKREKKPVTAVSTVSVINPELLAITFFNVWPYLWETRIHARCLAQNEALCGCPSKLWVPRPCKLSAFVCTDSALSKTLSCDLSAYTDCLMKNMLYRQGLLLMDNPVMICSEPALTVV